MAQLKNILCSKEGYFLQEDINLKCFFHVAHGFRYILVNYLDIKSTIMIKLDDDDIVYSIDSLIPLFLKIIHYRAAYLNGLW